MKNLFILAACAAVAFYAFDKCEEDPKSSPKMARVLVVVGDDASKTFEQNHRIDTVALAAICRGVEQTGGVVAMRTIGNPSGEAFLRCELKPLVQPHGTLSQRKEVQSENHHVQSKF